MSKEKFNENEALSFEASKKDLMEKSNKRAWTVAIFMTALSFLLGIAIILLFPLKTVELRVVKVAENGMIDIITELNEETLTTSEAIDKHFVSQYVKTREQYYYETLENDYMNTQLMSNENVANEYRAIYDGKNGRAEKYQNKKQIEVKILSIVLNDSNGTPTATVRANIVEKDLISNAEPIKITKVFTLSYDYFPNLRQTEKARLVNPLGFTTTSYRIDSEVN